MWLALTIAWFAGCVLALAAPQTARRMLAKYARWAAVILVLRAMRRVSGARAWPRTLDPRKRCRPASIRRLAGAALRRALRAPTPEHRARVIWALLKAPEYWTARLARRLLKRLTKLALTPRPLSENVRVVCVHFAAPACLDSS
jgi:hypothetical protein